MPTPLGLVAADNVFGVQTGSDLAVWAGALVGVALLVAGIGISRRGRG